MPTLSFNDEIRKYLQQICFVLPEFSHIDLSRVIVNTTAAKSNKRHGILAYVTPLKYKDGSDIFIRQRRNRTYRFQIDPFYKDGKEILYIINFLIPRFMHLSKENKIKTILHELYHISPLFNGDFRRFEGYSKIHGQSLEHYDKLIEGIYKRFLYAFPNFLEKRFFEDRYEFQTVIEPKPRLLNN
jgi:hypothetical protein